MWQLAVDLGSRGTKAARVLDGVVEPVALAGRPDLPSAVYLHQDGRLRAGWEAIDRGAIQPDRLETTPRRWLANGSTMVVGGAVVPVADALEAVLRAVLDETSGAVGAPPSTLTVTHPAGWPAGRIALLADAAQRLGVPMAGLVPEPVAAVAGALAGLRMGAVVAVYDLGAGSLGTSVVQQTPAGLAILGRPGGHERMGGDVFDDRLLHFVGQRLAVTEPGMWDELDQGTDLRWQRARLALRIQVRQAREQLTASLATQLPIPMSGRYVPVRREDLESRIGHEVDLAATALHRTVVEAGIDPARIDHVLVVGGASRTPVVQFSLLTRFGERVVFAPEPDRIVAIGAARLAAQPEVVRVASPALVVGVQAPSSSPSSPSSVVFPAGPPSGPEPSGPTPNGAPAALAPFVPDLPRAPIDRNALFVHDSPSSPRPMVALGVTVAVLVAVLSVLVTILVLGR